MTIDLRFILASIILSTAVSAGAESAATTPRSARTLGPILAVLDTDHNGSLSANEIAAAPLALRALDINEDGVISADERRVAYADGRFARFSRGVTSLNVVLTLDANHDGDIQYMEIANAVLSLS